MTIFYAFDFGDCVMGGWVESARYPLGTIIEFTCGVYGQIVSQTHRGGHIVYRVQNVKYLRSPIEAETAIETLRRTGWAKVATLRDGQLRSTVTHGGFVE